MSERSEQTSERSGARKRSKWCGLSERVSGASKRANGRASGPVLQSVFLVVLAHYLEELLIILESPKGVVVAGFIGG